MRVSLLRTAVSSACLLSLAAISVADLKVVAEIKMSVNGDYHPTIVSKTYFHGDWVRVDADHKTILTNIVTRKSITIDHVAKTYSVSASNEMFSMLQGMNPKVTVSVIPTDEGKLVLDHQTKKFHCAIDLAMKPPMAGAKDVHVKGEMDCWVAEDVKWAGSGESWRAQQTLLFGLLDMKGLESAKSEFAKIKGFPLENHLTMTVDSPDMPTGGPAIELDYDALSLSQADLNLALFRVPADYKAQDAQGWAPVKG